MLLHITQLQPERKVQNISIPELYPSTPNTSTDPVKDLFSEGGDMHRTPRAPSLEVIKLTNKQQITHMVLCFSFVYTRRKK